MPVSPSGSTSVRRFVMVSLVIACLLGVASLVILGSGKSARQRESLLVHELKHQSGELAQLRASIDELSAKLQGISVARCSVATSAAGGVTPDAIEVAVQRAMDQREQQATAELQAKAQPSDENLDAFAQSEQLLDEAVKAKSWTDREAASFRSLLGLVSGEQSATLLQRLSVAINEGQLAVNTAGPPF